MNLEQVHTVHFLGIGGIGMSALARHFLAEGKRVSGSDRSPSDITRALTNEGAQVFEGHSAENVLEGTELVVYTEAVTEQSEGYVELRLARERGIPTVNYFEALGMVANEHYLIAVAGSHGKTTTTSMLIDIFEDAGLDPSAVVGSLRSRTGSNYRRGKGKYFIVEACEYKRDFLHLTPDVLVITNVEAEHLDYYRDLDDVISAFNTLAKKVSEEGVIICNAKDPVLARVTESVSAKVVDYTKTLDLLAPMKQPGMHNRMNAAAAMAAAAAVGIPKEKAQTTVSAYAGSWRRFEYKGKTATGALIYDDYGHHPTEIAATLAGTRELYPDKKILLVYQPHMYSRTHALFDEFVNVLGRADAVVLLPIYAAREPNESGVSSAQLVENIGPSASVAETFDEAVDIVHAQATDQYVVLVMGAGDIVHVSEKLLA